MAEHKHGEMDITDQEQTFAGFIKAAIWVVGISIFVLIFLAVFNS
ncbi:aa3-type cytochrome c oxidase subunit IV [Pseudooceanicola sp.]|nr:aa3-type cytochrome c oxidase subunit IV [Pseudooceanicola sp.]MDF1855332.1 aa3-type cytochrome c oxidase subunit IV [Pseudooceanicola sp.]